MATCLAAVTDIPVAIGVLRPFSSFAGACVRPVDGAATAWRSCPPPPQRVPQRRMLSSASAEIGTICGFMVAACMGRGDLDPHALRAMAFDEIQDQVQDDLVGFLHRCGAGTIYHHGQIADGQISPAAFA